MYTKLWGQSLLQNGHLEDQH